ncbi:glycosyltransferase family 2 protein [Curtobacterium sp. MCBD17_023]|uniref:glycosyltransferase family 2 protein n=1 Tax=Curtobacterium sp. MCBD17_023 TaxID=2175657 RepID=UPI000D8F4B0C|nr:hypothetical protein DEI84_10340 [Curtobacterium sp. MCBD17_023]
MIDVVVPTTGRSTLRRAVMSALAQPEVARVIVVLDRPEVEVEIASMLAGTRAEIVCSTGMQGGGACRRIGTRLATADWIAYLDDDDYWAQGRFGEDYVSVLSCSAQRVLITAGFNLVQDSSTTDQSVRRIPRHPPTFRNEGLATYLAERSSFRYGATGLQSSAILVSAVLGRAVEWDPTLRKHQDWDFLIRCSEIADVKVHVNATRVFTQQGSADSISRRREWRDSQAFLLRHESSMSPRSRADFVLVHIMRAAISQRDLRGVRFALGRIHAVPHLAAVAVALAGLPAAFLTERRTKQ